MDDGGFDAGEFGEFGWDVLQVEEKLVDDLVIELLDLSRIKSYFIEILLILELFLYQRLDHLNEFYINVYVLIQLCLNIAIQQPNGAIGLVLDRLMVDECARGVFF